MVLLCCFNSCKHKQFFFSIIMLKESCWHLLLHFMTEEEKILASHRCHAMHYQTPQDSLSKILSIVEPCLLACCLSGDPAAGGPRPRAAPASVSVSPFCVELLGGFYNGKLLCRQQVEGNTKFPHQRTCSNTIEKKSVFEWQWNLPFFFSSFFLQEAPFSYIVRKANVRARGKGKEG